jgi:hypothetical protein
MSYAESSVFNALRKGRRTLVGAALLSLSSIHVPPATRRVRRIIRC